MASFKILCVADWNLMFPGKPYFGYDFCKIFLVYICLTGFIRVRQFSSLHIYISNFVVKLVLLTFAVPRSNNTLIVLGCKMLFPRIILLSFSSIMQR